MTGFNDNRPRKFRIGILGSYGGLNLGDEAILQVIVAQLRNSLPVEITVFSHNPEDTLSRHGVERALLLEKLTREDLRPEFERMGLLVLGGGGILFDSYVRPNLRMVELALETGTPVMVYAVGAGPLEDRHEQQIVRDCLNRAAAVTVRAKTSSKLLEEIGVRQRIEVTADPAFLLDPDPPSPDTLTREGLEGKHRLIGMSVREPGPAAPDLSERDYHRLLSNAADFMVDRYDADIVFVPMERSVMDLQHAHAVVAQMAFADRATVLKGQYTSGQMLSLMSHFTFAVGMRLHFLIFAALQRIPFVALPYAGKVASLLEDFQMPPLKVVNSGRLIAHIDRCWDLRGEYRARIDKALPALQERARLSHEIAVRLLMSRQAVGNGSHQ